MFCVNCGKEITRQDKFCPFCGTDNRYYRPDEEREEPREDFREALEAAADSEPAEAVEPLSPDMMDEEAADTDIDSILNTVNIVALYGVNHSRKKRHREEAHLLEDREEPGYSWRRLLSEDENERLEARVGLDHQARPERREDSVHQARPEIREDTDNQVQSVRRPDSDDQVQYGRRAEPGIESAPEKAGDSENEAESDGFRAPESEEADGEEAPRRKKPVFLLALIAVLAAAAVLVFILRKPGTVEEIMEEEPPLAAASDMGFDEMEEIQSGDDSQKEEESSGGTVENSGSREDSGKDKKENTAQDVSWEAERYQRKPENIGWNVEDSGKKEEEFYGDDVNQPESKTKEEKGASGTVLLDEPGSSEKTDVEEKLEEIEDAFSERDHVDELSGREDRALFEDLLQDEAYNGFLRSDFQDPTEIDWNDVFHDGAGVAKNVLTPEEEKAYLRETGFDEVELKVTALTLDTVRGFVKDYTGLNYDDALYPLDWYYLPKQKLYVSEHEDSNHMETKLTRAVGTGGYVRLYYTGKNWDGNHPDYVLTLQKNGDSYRVFSNLPVNEAQDGFSDELLRKMAADYYEHRHSSRPRYADLEVDDAAAGTVTIRLYDDMGDHIATSALYTVSRKTGKGVDEIDGKTIDLSE